MTQRVALYARYSSDAQNAASVEDQNRLCRRHAEREGWIIVGEHADAAISGAIRDRPGLNRLMASVEKGLVDVVLSESLDRLARDLEHVASLYKRVTFHGAQIVTLSEGPVNDLHVGLRGAMAAMFLKDLAAKTHRGLEGRIRQGRAIGHPPYGYRLVRKLDGNGEPERGLRAIEAIEAGVVHRIFQLYCDGMKPLQIARLLNAEGIPGPSGGVWLADSVRGRATRRDGVLNNPIYAGRLVWNRRRGLKDPATGQKVRRENSAAVHVEIDVPHLRIIDDALWQAVQARLRANAAAPNPVATAGQPGFWDRRRPRNLLTGKAYCGLCGRPYAAVGKDYLACIDAHHGGCTNRISMRRGKLDRLVVEGLRERLMASPVLSAFIEVLREERERIVAGLQATTVSQSRQRATLERRIAHLVDELSDGSRSPGIRSRLAEFECQLEQLGAPGIPIVPDIPPLPGDLGAVYRTRLAGLEAALGQNATPEILEAARALITRVEIHPPAEPGGPPGIALEASLPHMLRLSGVGENKHGGAQGAGLLDQAIECSVKRDPRATPQRVEGSALALLATIPQPAQGQRVALDAEAGHGHDADGTDFGDGAAAGGVGDVDFDHREFHLGDGGVEGGVAAGEAGGVDDGAVEIRVVGGVEAVDHQALGIGVEDLDGDAQLGGVFADLRVVFGEFHRAEGFEHGLAAHVHAGAVDDEDIFHGVSLISYGQPSAFSTSPAR